MALSKDVQAWLDWQNDQFMVVYTDEMNYFPDDVSAGTPVDDVETKSGWFARLSAPGYLDCTDWMGPYSTEDEAIEALYDMYGDDMPEDDD